MACARGRDGRSAPCWPQQALQPPLAANTSNPLAATHAESSPEAILKVGYTVPAGENSSNWVKGKGGVEV